MADAAIAAHVYRDELDLRLCEAVPYHQALSSGIRVLHNFARTLLIHAQGILAWYDYPISTGPLEGTNNKIKTLNRQHYGLRDGDFFQLKLYQLQCR